MRTRTSEAERIALGEGGARDAAAERVAAARAAAGLGGGGAGGVDELGSRASGEVLAVLLGSEELIPTSAARPRRLDAAARAPGGDVGCGGDARRAC